MTAPIAIEMRPTKRSWPSVSWVRRRKASRHVAGATSGSTPSSRRTNPHAARNVSGTTRSPSARSLLRAGARCALAAAGLLQVLEELRVRIEHHQVVLVAERRLVGLEAAIEGVE